MLTSRSGFFLCFIILVLAFEKSWGKLNIVFDPKYSPSANIPDVSRRAYSLPLYRIMAPLRATLEIDGILVTEDIDDNIAHASVIITSVDVDVYNNVAGAVDEWANPDCKLCRWLDKKSRMPSLDFDLNAEDGVIYTDGLCHCCDKIPSRSRVLKVEVHHDNGTIWVNATNPVIVEVGVGALQFSSDFPTVVKKSIPFEFSLQLLDYTSKLITNGTDSIALIRLTISKEAHIFSPDMKINASVHENVIEKKATGGIVTFSDFRFKNVHAALKFDASNVKSIHPWCKDYYANTVTTHASSSEFNVIDGTFTDIKLIFDPAFAPPLEIPENSKRMYNLPLNSIIAPIHAVLKVHGIIANVEEHGSLPSARYSVESVDVDVHMNKTDVDQWKKDDGMLCRWKSLHDTLCGTDEDKTTLTRELQLEKGHLSINDIYHFHKSNTKSPQKKRVLVFVISWIKIRVVNATNPILVDTPAWTLKFTEDFPTSISPFVNFNVTLQILDKEENIVTTGLDSVARATLQISMENKYKFKMFGPGLRRTSLLGDFLFDRNAEAGVIAFPDLFFKSGPSVLKLNATLFRYGDNSQRSKADYERAGIAVPVVNVMSKKLKVKGIRITFDFDPEYSPPKTMPESSKRAYNLPLSRIMKPISATLLINDIKATVEKHGELANVPFTIESVDIYVFNHVEGVIDDWGTKGGRLCRWYEPSPNDLELDCNGTIVTKHLNAYNGNIIVGGLFHYHKNLVQNPKRKRRLKFTIRLDDGSVFENFTNSVYIGKPGWTLKYSSHFPKEVRAGTPFNITLQILDFEGKAMYSGLDSKASVALRVSWNNKKGVEITGPGAHRSSRYDDSVFNKEAIKGKVIFKDIRILNFHPGLKLNVTLLKVADQWQVSPNAYIKYNFVFGITGRGMQAATVFSPAIKVTIPRINVVFYSKFSPPPSIPDFTKRKFSVPLSRIVYPLRAYIQVDGGPVNPEKHPDLANVECTVETIDVDVYRKVEGAVDKWNGHLCKRPPGGLKTCRGKKFKQTAENGNISFVGLLHFEDEDSVPRNKRVFTVTVSLPNNTFVQNTTYPYVIDPIATMLTFSRLPHRVPLQNPFNFSVSIWSTLNHLVTGTYSAGLVEISVSEKFYQKVILSGPNVEKNTHLGINVIRKRASGSRVTFFGIKILTAYEDITLTATLYYTPAEAIRKLFHDEDLAVIASTISDPFSVVEQHASALILLTPIVSDIGANFLLVPDIVVELRDEVGIRISTGRESSLDLKIKTIPAKVCLSGDSKLTLQSGRGIFFGSICEPVKAVQIYFEAVLEKGRVIRTNASRKFRVIGEIHLAHFSTFQGAWMKPSMGAMETLFIEKALDSIKNKKYPGLLENRRLIIKDFETHNNVIQTTRIFEGMIKLGERTPRKKIQGIIGLGQNALTENLGPLLKYYKMPSIALREFSSEFADKKEYPYFSRVCWDARTMKLNVLYAFVIRGWSRVTVISDEKTYMRRSQYEEVREFGIQIVLEVIVRNRDTDKDLDSTIKDVKKSNTKIILMNVGAPLNARVLRTAINNEIACMHGYQWVTFEQSTWQFPWTNQHKDCRQKPICTVAFKGLHAFSATYQLAKDFESDIQFDSVESPEYGDIQTLQLYALAHDAALVYAKALTDIINANLTIHGQLLTDYIRKVDIPGITGRLHFFPNGSRPGYIGYLVTVNPDPPELGIYVSQVAVYSRYLVSDGFASHKEYRMRALPPLDMKYVEAPTTFPNTTYVNKRHYKTVTGMIVDEKGSLQPIPPDTKRPTETYITENSVAPYYCVAGCGGIQLDDRDITMYEFGSCTAMDQCECKDGYRGDSCNETICDCHFGKCEIAGVCTCSPGWTGEKCDGAMCEDCVHGECTEPDVCTCEPKWTGPGCNHSMTSVALIAGFLLIFLTITFVLFYRYMERRSALKNLDWVVIWEEIQEHDGEKSSLRSSSVYTGSDSELQLPNTVIWKHCRCYIKRYNIGSLDPAKDSLRKEILLMKEMKHNNIIAFVGACLDAPNVCLLYEHCTKGSLQDVLLDDSVTLDWDFRFSLLKDICRGMNYIHNSTIKSHGTLKSSKCLIDSRWSCKVSGFGFPTFRYEAPRLPPKEEDPETNISTMFWTAPELLRVHNTQVDVHSGTKAGDVYSFAIIVVETISRDEPYNFELVELEGTDVISLLKADDFITNVEALKKLECLGAIYSDIFRPHVKPTHEPQNGKALVELIELLRTAWSEDPVERPAFKTMLHDLNRIYPIEGELIDNLLNMLQKYSSDLETLVAERTKDLEAEKLKSEELVSRMLPKKVADDLKYGNKVDPESFESATVFFSDIVGFSMIVSQSTALEVVELLNDLYTTFDDIIDPYDVYKVETIGDAYMVVSGLPIRNGNLHAGEIATMALDLLSSLSTFEIKHMPNRMVQLRGGIHSGPVVAGVIGLKMPRYCLFGDTVNTAARMESSAFALRIQMSESTTHLLQNLGGYRMDCRGQINVKGKGKMTTYWLLGKDTFTKPLPDLSLALPLSLHEFK